MSLHFVASFLSHRQRVQSQRLISAIIRLKSPSPYINNVILNILSSVDEIIIVDNSHKPTFCYLASISHKIVYKYYPYELYPMCSKAHREASADDPRTLAAFYNYAFSFGTSKFRLKVDDDDLYTVTGLSRLRNMALKLDENHIIYFNGLNIDGNLDLVNGIPVCGGRDHFMIGSSVSYQFRQGKLWEELVTSKTTKKKWAGICYFHLKYLNNNPYDKHLSSENSQYLSAISKETLTGKPKPVNGISRIFYHIFPMARPNSYASDQEIYRFTQANMSALIDLRKDRDSN